MEHLSLETLARLVDEAPDDREREHLDGCQRCRTELELLSGQTRALAELPDLRPAQGEWGVLEARLMSEGLVRHQRSSLASTPAWMKVAAAILLFVGGTGVGMGVAARGVDGGAVPLAGIESSPFSLTSSSVNSLGEAEERVRLAERQYMDALVQYRQLATSQEGELGGAAPESRLAALEYLVAAGQAAVQQAPTDPFLNGFLASALAERQATYQATLAATGSGADWY